MFSDVPNCLTFVSCNDGAITFHFQRLQRQRFGHGGLARDGSGLEAVAVPQQPHLHLGRLGLWRNRNSGFDCIRPRLPHSVSSASASFPRIPGAKIKLDIKYNVNKISLT